MPALSYAAITDYPFQPFTKIYSSDINGMFAAISTLLNTTGLDDTNIQALGISLSKLKQSSAVAGQFPSWNGSAWVATGNPLTSQFNIVMGSAAQVTAGTATNSTFAGYTQADGDRVLVLPGYSTNESVSITKKLYIQGLGNTSQILGAITLGTGSSYTILKGFRTTNDLTVNSGSIGIYGEDLWFSGSHTFVDNNSTPSNLLIGMQE
jgi:hypothetical protein